MTELERIRRAADATIPHARVCKLALSDCLRCKLAVEYYASLPLDTLALVLQDRPTYKPAK